MTHACEPNRYRQGSYLLGSVYPQGSKILCMHTGAGGQRAKAKERAALREGGAVSKRAALGEGGAVSERAAGGE